MIQNKIEHNFIEHYMKRYLLSTLFIALVISFVPGINAVAQDAIAREEKPKVAVENTIDSLVKIVSASDPETISGDEKKSQRKAMREILDPRFDFSEMARRSLGAHWKGLEATEKKEFVNVFSSLLAHTYLNRIEKIKPGMVTVDSESVRVPKSGKGFTTAVVKTTVNSSGELFPINYKLVKRTTGWRVYDVIIENIGLISNYRNEFAGIIRKKSFSGLLESLKTKVSKQ